MDDQKALTIFQEKNLGIFKKLSELKKEIAHLQDTEKKAKELLKKAMNEYGITSYKDELISISSVSASPDKVVFDLDAFMLADPKTYKEVLDDYPLTILDLEKWQLDEPENYQEFLEAYNKVVKGKSGYIRIEAK
jgi:hypothetical protein